MLSEYSAKYKDFLKSCCPQLPDSPWLETLENFYREFIQINSIHNLSTITEPEDFWLKHILDSLSIGLVYPQIFKSSLSLADIGCGGGFPSIPLAVFNEKLLVCGLDSNLKKAALVNELGCLCGVSNFEAFPLRSLEASQNREFKRSFDLVTARAAGKAGKLLKECYPLLKPGGSMIFYKTPSGVEKEESEARELAQKYHFTYTKSALINLPENTGSRQFMMFVKGGREQQTNSYR